MISARPASFYSSKGRRPNAEVVSLLDHSVTARGKRRALRLVSGQFSIIDYLSTS